MTFFQSHNGLRQNFVKIQQYILVNFYTIHFKFFVWFDLFMQKYNGSIDVGLCWREIIDAFFCLDKNHNICFWFFWLFFFFLNRNVFQFIFSFFVWFFFVGMIKLLVCMCVCVCVCVRERERGRERERKRVLEAVMTVTEWCVYGFSQSVYEVCVCV